MTLTTKIYCSDLDCDLDAVVEYKHTPASRGRLGSEGLPMEPDTEEETEILSIEIPAQTVDLTDQIVGKIVLGVLDEIEKSKK
jgi:hypothetical protein